MDRERVEKAMHVIKMIGEVGDEVRQKLAAALAEEDMESVTMNRTACSALMVEYATLASIITTLALQTGGRAWLADRGVDLDALFAAPAPAAPAPAPAPPSDICTHLDTLDPSLSYDEWIRVGMALHHDVGPDGFTLWDRWSAPSPKYPGTAALRQHWDSFGAGDGRRETRGAGRAGRDDGQSKH